MISFKLDGWVSWEEIAKLFMKWLCSPICVLLMGLGRYFMKTMKIKEQSVNCKNKLSDYPKLSGAKYRRKKVRESFCEQIVGHQQESWFLIGFHIFLGKHPQRELNGAADPIQHQPTTAMMEQAIGNMVFTWLEFHASSDNPLLQNMLKQLLRKRLPPSHSLQAETFDSWPCFYLSL